MPWETVSIEQLAKRLGMNYAEVRETHKLITLIVKTRKRLGLSQADVAKVVGVSQPRIAKIESGIGTKKITFDVLFRILVALGYDFKVTTRKEKFAA